MTNPDVLALLDTWRAAERSLEAMAADDGHRADAEALVNAAKTAYRRAFERVAAQRADKWDVLMSGDDALEYTG